MTILIVLSFINPLKIFAQIDVVNQEYKKLTLQIYKKIGHLDYLFDSTDNLPSVAMLSFHINEEKRVDSISVLCRKKSLAENLEKFDFQKIIVSWDILINNESLNKKGYSVFLPIVFLGDQYDFGKQLFSLEEIKFCFFENQFNSNPFIYLKNFILLRPITFTVSKSKK